ncbi:MAG: hypothetical protein H6868_09150 [Rhodospirillales bacterium]|nr:hypothetical protein [Rhodospirillales bacterium]
MSEEITFLFTDEDPGNEGVVKFKVYHDRDGNVVGERLYAERKNGGAVIHSRSMPDSLDESLPEALDFCREKGKNALLVIDPHNKFDMSLINKAG